jgi:hypothetical protein
VEYAGDAMDLVHEVAHKVWRNVEEYRKDNGYHDMAGLCALGSLALEHSLKAHGIRARTKFGTYDGDNHAWVEWNYHIVDITVSQFGVKKDILVTPLGSFASRHYNDEYAVKWNDGTFTDWDRPEKPSPAKIKKLAVVPGK